MVDTMTSEIGESRQNRLITPLRVVIVIGVLAAVSVNIYFRLQNNGGDAVVEESGGGLVAHWSFDEGSGEVVNDNVNGLMGEINGANWVKGIKGEALQFDGNGAIVEMDRESLDTVGAIKHGTVSMWFKYRGLGTTGILPLLYFGEDNDVGTISGIVIEIGHGSQADSKLYYTLYDNTSKPVLCFDSNENLKEDTWYHLAIVNSSQGNTGYLNGVELTDRHYNFGGKDDARFFNTMPKKDIFRLGYGWDGIEGKFHHFKGAIDELSFYDKPLTAAEVAELAKR